MPNNPKFEKKWKKVFPITCSNGRLSFHRIENTLFFSEKHKIQIYLSER